MDELHFEMDCSDLDGGSREHCESRETFLEPLKRNQGREKTSGVERSGATETEQSKPRNLEPQDANETMESYRERCGTLGSDRFGTTGSFRDRSGTIESYRNRSGTMGSSSDRSRAIEPYRNRSGTFGSSSDRPGMMGSYRDRSGTMSSSRSGSGTMGSFSDRSGTMETYIHRSGTLDSIRSRGTPRGTPDRLYRGSEGGGGRRKLGTFGFYTEDLLSPASINIGRSSRFVGLGTNICM